MNNVKHAFETLLLQGVKRKRAMEITGYTLPHGKKKYRKKYRAPIPIHTEPWRCETCGHMIKAACNTCLECEIERTKNVSF